MINWIQKEPRHIWKIIKEENLGSFIDFGCDFYDINTIYRITVYERCLLT